MADRSSPLRVAVFASGSGSNLQALLDRFHGLGGAKPPEARVVLVLASRPGIGALERAARHRVPAAVLPDDVRERGARGEAGFLLRALREHETELVVLAGWLRLVPAEVVGAFRDRMLNIHPALLPAFGGKGMYGRRVHRAVIESGARVTGPTVHLVDEEYDRGPIVAQWPVPVREDDDEETLAARVLAAEHRLLPAVVSAFACGRVRVRSEAACRSPLPWLRGERFLLEGEGGVCWLPSEEADA